MALPASFARSAVLQPQPGAYESGMLCFLPFAPLPAQLDHVHCRYPYRQTHRRAALSPAGKPLPAAPRARQLPAVCYLSSASCWALTLLDHAAKIAVTTPVCASAAMVFRHGNGGVSQGLSTATNAAALCWKKAHLQADGQVLSRKMEEARSQAQNCAPCLPTVKDSHAVLLIVDVGKTFELYAEFARSGAEHTRSPDAPKPPHPAGRGGSPRSPGGLRALWLDPMSLDPPANPPARHLQNCRHAGPTVAPPETRHPAEKKSPRFHPLPVYRVLLKTCAAA